MNEALSGVRINQYYGNPITGIALNEHHIRITFAPCKIGTVLYLNATVTSENSENHLSSDIKEVSSVAKSVLILRKYYHSEE